MAKTYKIGVIGFAHMHINHLVERFAAHPQAEADRLRGHTAAGPRTPALPTIRENGTLRHALEDLGVPKAYDDYNEMLKQETLDIVICCSENAQHPAVVEACAQNGVHLLVEKPMAILFG